jgi:hypothetical protein
METKERACGQEGCSGTYVPCPYNGYKQDRCAACARERRRMQQRRHAKEKYRNDAAFRERELERKRKLRNVTKKAEQSVEAEFAKTSLQAFSDVLTGLLAQLSDSDDARVVADQARLLGRRGQRLAIEGPLCRGGYPKADVEEIFPPRIEAG